MLCYQTSMSFNWLQTVTCDEEMRLCHSEDVVDGSSRQDLSHGLIDDVSVLSGLHFHRSQEPHDEQLMQDRVWRFDMNFIIYCIVCFYKPSSNTVPSLSSDCDPPNSPNGLVLLSPKHKSKPHIIALQVMRIIFSFKTLYLPWAPLLAWLACSSLTGEMMSNWMGVSGATSESREREDSAGDSDPAEHWLPDRAALGRPWLYRWRKRMRKKAV